MSDEKQKQSFDAKVIEFKAKLDDLLNTSGLPIVVINDCLIIEQSLVQKELDKKVSSEIDNVKKAGEVDGK